MGQAQAPQRGGARGLGIDQHFLVNRAVIAALLGAADLRAEFVVAELGAGRGTVAAWMPPVAHLDLIELDPALCRVLRERFATRADVRVRCDDAIGVLARECASYDVIFSNLPASLTPQMLDLLASNMGGACDGSSRIVSSASPASGSTAAVDDAPSCLPHAAIVAAPASLDLSPWEHRLEFSPIATAEGDDFDPPQPFATCFIRATKRSS